jgi:hypothetical protein
VANVWRTISATCVVPTVKLRGAGIRVRGCFLWNGLGSPVTLHENINAEGYKDILTSCVLYMVEDQFGDDSCLYQHYNDPAIIMVCDGMVCGQ